jgi:hypothetical protein
MTAIWRADIDSLAFRPEGHGGLCVMHRRAFRALLGREGEAQACLDWFAAHRNDFEAAARRKIAWTDLAPEANFHLTSRDLKRVAASG